jgi:hypothetical protein
MSTENLLKEIRKILFEIEDLEEKRRESYYAGLSDSTASKRSAQFNKQSKKHWDDPSAYKKAPGDSKKTKPSKWNEKFKKMYGEGEELDEVFGSPPGGNLTGEGDDCSECGVTESDFDESDFTYAAAQAAAAGKKTFKFGGKEHQVKMSKEKGEKIIGEREEIVEALLAADDILCEEDIIEGLSEKTRTALKNKAEKSRAPLGALTTVYNKGLAAWRTGHRPGANQHAWAMARVNSFLAGGPARKVDNAQWKQVQKHRKKKK